MSMQSSTLSNIGKSAVAIIGIPLTYLSTTAIIFTLTRDAVISACLTNGLVILVCGIPLYRRHRSRTYYPQATPIRGKTLVVLIVTAMLMVYTGQSVAQGVRVIIGDPSFAEHRQRMIDTPWPLVLLLSLVLAPVAEELMIRGTLQPILRSWWSPTVSITITALVFSFMHGNMVQFAGTLSLGLITGWLYEHTHSILASIAAHVGFNLMAAVTPSSVFATTMTWQLIVAIILFGAASILWMLIWKNTTVSTSRTAISDPA